MRTLLLTSDTMSVYVMRCVCVLLVILLTVVRSQNVEDDLELEQDELIDDEFENTLQDEELEEEVLETPEELAPDISNPSLNLESTPGDLQSVVTTANVFNNTSLQVEEDVENHEQAFVTSFFVTVMSELGDKTFFMSAILAMNHSRTLTFIGSTIGQTIMTLVAVIFGMAASLIPEFYTQWASAIIMTFFGVKMLKDGSKMDDNLDGHDKTLQTEPNKQEVQLSSGNNNVDLQTTKKKDETKLDDKQEIKSNSENNNEEEKSEIQDKKDETQHNKQSIHGKIDENDNKELVKENNIEDKILDSKKNGIIETKPISVEKPPEYTKGVLLQALTLCLMGEWGDKSQIATILLASNGDPYVVAAGGVVGHILCNALAVFGGRMLASKFPAKIVTQMGGVFFLLAAASSFVFS